MFRSRSWFAGGWGRPKNPHSLEHLKYLYNVLTRNQTVSEHNRELLVESLRCIAEILIWGDQNDSSVFDFFLEKNMLSYFLRIMRQRSGGSSFVCVQLLQTLNILFENIRNETSLYYLLSNNHVNSIIVHKFDFSDEEVMAYYISFLKTLSLKLNGHTIHFFYNEHTNDFPLYTEAIKFFNHPESMVRIAVRTLTLNVYRVQDASMLKFIRDRTAAPYFSNLVWFIGKHILELDSCVINDADHQSQQKLDDLVAEHLDHLHYINDILCLTIPDLNDVLTEHLLHKLFIPLYIYSLTTPDSHKSRRLPKSPPYTVSSPKSKTQLQNIETLTKNLASILSPKSADMSPDQKKYQIRKEDSVEDEIKPRVSCVVALFLLSQVFLIITHEPIVQALAWIILHSDSSIFEYGVTRILDSVLKTRKSMVKLEFSKPPVSLEIALESALPTGSSRVGNSESEEAPATGTFEADHSYDLDPDLVSNSLPSTSHLSASSSIRNSSDDLSLAAAVINPDYSSNVAESSLRDRHLEALISNSNITDEEKEKLVLKTIPLKAKRPSIDGESSTPIDVLLDRKPFLKTVLDSLDCTDNDYKALFALCLLFALINNKGVNMELLSLLLSPSQEPTVSDGDGSNKDSLFQQLTCNAILVEKLIVIISLCCQQKSRVRLVTLELALRLLRSSAAPPSPALLRRVEAAKQKSAALVRNFYKSDDIFLDMFEEEYCEMTKRPLNVEWLCMDAAILLPPTGTPMSGISFAKRLPCGEIERARRAIRSYFLIRSSWLELSGEPEQQLPLTPPHSYIKVGSILDLNNSDLLSCMITCADGTRARRFMAVDSVQLILVEPSSRLGWGEAKLVGSLQDLEVTSDKDDTRCLQLTIHRPPGSGGHPTGPRLPILQAKFKFDDYIRCMAAKQRLTKSRVKLRQKKMQQIARLLEVPGAGGSGNSGMQGSSGVILAGTTTRHQHRSLLASRAALIRRDTPSVERISGNTHSESADNRPRRPSAQLLKDSSRDRTRSRDSSRGSKDGSPRPPRPRSEEIPLEDMKRASADGLEAPASSSSVQIRERPQLPIAKEDLPTQSKQPEITESDPGPRPTLQAQKSEETSFIAGSTKESSRKKKGTIETV